MLKKITARERLQETIRKGYDSISNEKLREITQKNEVITILRDRRLRFLGHNLRHYEPITCNCLTEELLKKEPGKWASLMLGDIRWFARRLQEKG